MTANSNASHAYFTSIPWTSRLLANPNLHISLLPSRTPKVSTEDSLTATTLATPNTIPHCLVYYPLPSTPSDLDAISILLKVESGCNGHPHILHGGIVATLLDESMGSLLQQIEERKHAESAAEGSAQSIGSFTKYLNVEFLAPMKTPSVILAKVKVVERRGRGVKVLASLFQKDGAEGELDGQLIECARGEGLFVTPRAKL